MNVSRHEDGYQVRIVRRGKLHTRWVPKSRPRAATAAARLARRLRARLPQFQADRLKKEAGSNTGVVGITRSVFRERRRGRKPRIERRFQIAIVDARGKRRNLCVRFTPATERAAWRRALALRKAFERAAARRRVS